MIVDRQRRDALVAVSKLLGARGWVANHDGNVTARLGPGRFLATPTATSKREVGPQNLIVVDEKGERISGDAKPFGEIGLHLTVYANRPDVQAVVHAHPPAATGIACAGSRLLERPFIAEAVVSLGAVIPTVPFALPGREACAALAAYVGSYDAVLMANHGVIAWGADLEQAYLRLELVEHLAQIALQAERAGGVKPLPESALGPLLEARRKAFPHVAAANASAAAAPSLPPGAPVVACAPAPPGATVTTTTISRPPSELATIIREELIKALRDR
jgi:L-fuculose-phosphate aldolase